MKRDVLIDQDFSVFEVMSDGCSLYRGRDMETHENILISFAWSKNERASSTSNSAL